jgi:Sulfotransferase domain
MPIFIIVVNAVIITAVFFYLRHRIKKTNHRLSARLAKLEKKLARLHAKIAQGQPDKTTTFDVSLTDGSKVSFEMPRPNPTFSGPFFALGPHKSGTVLMNGLLAELGRVSGLPFFDLPGAAFKQGIDVAHLKGVGGLFSQKGICFGGFRTAWLGDDDLTIPPGGVAMVLLRDPRDILVSLFYSVAKSHTIPEEGKIRDSMLAARDQAARSDIDEWVILHAEKMLPKLERWANWIERHTEDEIRVFRYEDVIFKKRLWVRNLALVLGLNCDPKIMDEIADRHDIQPGTENVGGHIRSVAPGNYKDKLKPDTISRLNETLKKPAKRLGYCLQKA